MSLRPSSAPTQLGRYEVICALGVGGMARVYLAMQRGPVATKVVVVKHLRPEFAHDPAFVDMFVDESRIGVRMNHPNVIHTYEASSDGDDHYLVMEFLEGKTLAQLLKAVGREAMPVELHLWVLSEVLTGLRYAHELCDFDGAALNIVHRDLSPSNVLITRDGSVKIVDFGIAKISGAIAETQHGVIKGKIGYASPEQCLGQPADARSDVYSVGVMLWEAVAGRRRLIGETAMVAVQARVQDREPDIESIAANVAPALAAIVRRAVAFNPDQRYQTAAELQGALHEYLLHAEFSAGAFQAGRLISSHFSEELTQLRRLIEERVGSVKLRSVQSAPPSPPESGSLGALSSRAPQESSPTLLEGILARTSHRLVRPLMIALAVAVSLLVFVTFFVRGREVTVALPPSAAGLVKAPAPEPSAVNAPAVPGHPSADNAAAVSSDPPIEVAPHRTTAPGRRVKPGSAVVARGPGVALSPVQSALPAAPTGSPSSLEPGADLKGRTRTVPHSTRPIDEQDPFR